MKKKIKYAIRFDLKHREKTSEKLKYCLKMEGHEMTIEIKLDHFPLGQVELVV